MLQFIAPFGGIPGAFAIRLLLDVLQVLLLIRMAASLLAPRSTHPLIVLVERATEPVLRQAREFVPPVGRIDVSPAIVFFLADLLKWLVTRAMIPV